MGNTIKIKRLYSNSQIPTRGSKQAAGYDLYACLPVSQEFELIPPHSTVKISSGVAIELPEGHAGMIYARSGIATKRGLRPGNCVGVVDAN